MEDYRTILFTVVANTYALSKNKYAMGLEIPVQTFWNMSPSLYQVTDSVIDYIGSYVSSLPPLPEIKIMDNKEVEQERAIRKDVRDKVRLLKIFLNQLYRLKPEWSVKPTYYRGNTIGYDVATISDFLVYLTDCFSEYV